MPTLYRLQVARDEYLGTAEEVVAFLARAEGAPATDPAGYMRGVATRLATEMGVTGIRTGDAEAFLTSLSEAGVVQVQALAAPSEERTAPEDAIGTRDVVFGPGVDPDDVSLPEPGSS